MRSLVSISACFLLSACFLSAQETSKPNLSGTWRLNAQRSELHSTHVSGAASWVIEEKDDSIHITESEGGKKIELQCPTNGKECEVTGGEKAKASFWYNGPILVEMETKGQNATRYRMNLSPEGKALTVEITYIVPQEDKPDKLFFEKQ